MRVSIRMIECKREIEKEIQREIEREEGTEEEEGLLCSTLRDLLDLFLFQSHLARLQLLLSVLQICRLCIH